ncbi:MAG TPA: peptide ABC transporter substrate-binding protein [Verrucomicrobiota bacterium]|nr:peptide ABC transporter substrate-binding protein [Verrucomicrobiota bacterium]
MKRFCVICCVLALILNAGCGRRETRVEYGNRNQILYKGNGTEPADLDPQIVTGVTEHHTIMALIEGLVTEDPKDLHPVPGVAERWDISPDGRVYTFHLRKNAKWSNGDPVTAHDFWESYKRILTPSLASKYAYMHFVVTNAEAFNKGTITDFNEVGYKVLDDHTFQITLKSATPYFLSLMNHTSWFPVHLPTVRQYGDPYKRGNKWTRPGHFVGNGPFVLDEWKVNAVIVAKKSPTYWDRDNVRLNEIRFYPIDSADTEERAFRSGQLHITETIPLPKIEAYKQKHPQFLHIDPYLGTYFYRINTTKPPLNDKRVRKALAMAINREAIVERITRGGQIPAYHFTPPGTAGYLTRARIGNDVAEARKLLAAAGYPDGKGFPAVELLFNTSEAHRAIAEAIQQMWKENLGIEIKLVNQEWKVYLDSQRTLDYQICRAGWIADYVDPNSFLDMWVEGGGNNETGWGNPEYDRLIAMASRENDPEKRMELFQQAETILLDELPVIPVYFYTHVGLRRPEVKGWYPTILDNHPYKYVYLEEPKN